MPMHLNPNFFSIKSFTKLLASQYHPRLNTIYLGNGLLDYQAVHFTHISVQYLQHPRTLTVICESNPSEAFKRSLSRLAPATNIRFISLPCQILNTAPINALRLVLILPFAILLANLTNRKSLLDTSNSWFLTQILHGVWDHSLRFSPTNSFTPSFRQKILSATSNIHQLFKAIQYALIYRPSLIFLGHSVYSARSALAFYRTLPIPVYLHSFNTLNRIPNDFDSSLFTPTPIEAKSLLHIARSFEASSFWHSRLAGNTNYFDASLSFQGLQTTDKTPSNIVYLHIFKDSPFNHIDRTRIFADYYEWILETLRILGHSSESWLIKTHPSSLRWGEDSLATLDTLAKYVFPHGLPPHILTDDSSLSNSSILANAKRVVTYSGSVHLEAAAYGIKPIVISSTLLESLLPSLVHKPTTLSNYQQLLCEPSSSSIFKLSQLDINLSRQILELKEDHLTYTNEYSILPVYAGDSHDYLDIVTQKFLASYNPDNAFTIQLAHYLSRGLTRSTSSTILETFYNLNRKPTSN